MAWGIRSGGARAFGFVGVALLAACSSPGSEAGGGSAGGNGTGGAGANGTGGASSAVSGSGGSAGASSSAGAAGSGNTAGSGGSTTASSQLEACLTYVQGFCELEARCGGNVPRVRERCLAAASASCPDVVFSPGSTRTVEGLLACGAAYSAWSCERYLAGEAPDCTTPGTRAVGDSCTFASQCASLKCSTALDCGACLTAAPPDGACSETTACPAGQICDGARCVGDPSLRKFRKLGEACDSLRDDCSHELRCSTSTKKCESLPRVNEPCTSTCVVGSVCDRALGRCVPAPGAGQPCYEGELESTCATGTYCDEASICQPLPGEGQACAGSRCADGFACHEDLKCRARGSSSSCAVDNECAVGARCVEKRCLPEVALHAPCDASNTCPALSTCRNGACQPNDLQGLFEALCMP